MRSGANRSVGKPLVRAGFSRCAEQQSGFCDSGQHEARDATTNIKALFGRYRNQFTASSVVGILNNSIARQAPLRRSHRFGVCRCVTFNGVESLSEKVKQSPARRNEMSARRWRTHSKVKPERYFVSNYFLVVCSHGVSAVQSLCDDGIWFTFR